LGAAYPLAARQHQGSGGRNYAIKTQDATGLVFGDVQQTQSPQLASDLTKLKGKGVKIYLVEDALRERGIHITELIEGMDLIPRQQLPRLFAVYDQIWHW
jgi:sulfur relay (sulfurtransferase) DsrF/TusC family protein